MLFRQFALAAATISLAKAADLTGYEYVVVGSGAGELSLLDDIPKARC